MSVRSITKTAAKARLAAAVTRYFGLLRREVNTEQRRITAYASTRDMDRYGTVFEPTAFQSTLDAYLRNPIVLGGHAHSYDTGEAPVIGRVTSASIDERGLLVEIEFAEGGVADVWWQRYRDGFMRALSVGVLINKYEERKREDGSVYTAYTDLDLIEISCVAAPGNPFALVRGLVAAEDLDDLETDAAQSAAPAPAPPATSPPPPPATPPAPATVTPASADNAASGAAGLSGEEIAALRGLLAGVSAVRDGMRGMRADIDALLLDRRRAGKDQDTHTTTPEPRGAAPTHGREASPLGFLGL